MPVGRARGQNVHIQNTMFMLQSFLELQILTTTYQKAFILRPYVQCRVLFHSMISDPRVLGQGWGSRSEATASLKYGTSVFSRQRLIRKHSYLNNRYPVGLVLFPCHRTPVSLSESSIFSTS